jgi:glycosyltransferase involved in cell wall biosynthesis
MGKMEQEIIRFSVIMPLYNKAAYVEKAIRSVLEQTYSHYELIVVNDGSKDNSAIIAEELLKDVPNAILINQENAGVAVARNNGVAQAKGDYVCFLDADDWWDVSFLQEMQQFIKDYPEAGIWGTNYWYVKKGKTHVAVPCETGYINYPKLYAETSAMPLTSISVCIERKLFDELGGFPLGIKLGEDFLLWTKIALHHKVAFLNKAVAYYNNDIPASLRATRNLHAPDCHMLFKMQYLESIVEKEDSVIENKADWKQLLDKLRVYGLLEYWMSDEYHDIAKQELTKVDWNKQPAKVCKIYNTPIWLLRAKQGFMRVGSFVKQSLIRLIVR